MTDPQCWLHPDTRLTLATGVSFHLRFVGSIPVHVSIKSVNLDMRTQIAHAAIHQAITDAGLQVSRVRRFNKSISSFLGPETNRRLSLTKIQLTVTSRALFVETLDSNQLLFKHDLSTVSFASGGDAETSNFVCYVAKNSAEERSCYVFDCFDGLAQDVIMTLGQAFQLGFQEFKQNQSHLRGSTTTNGSSSSPICSPTFRRSASLTNDPHVPETCIFTNPSKLTDSVQHTNAQRSTDSLSPKSSVHLQDNDVSDADGETDVDTWLMDVPLIPSAPVRERGHALVHRFNYVNIPSDEQDNGGASSNLPKPRSQANATPPVIQSADRFRQLEPVGEPWYVGQMSRAEAEKLLRYEGDFLVRASPHQPGQFVLSGLQDNKCRHLLLADPSGQVRTKDCVFDSIQHLIDYHVQNGIPIHSADSEIRLIFPVSANTLCEEL